MSLAAWSLAIGLLRITLVLSGTLLKRLPLSTAMLYLAAGIALGPAGWAVLVIHPLDHALLLERSTEVVALVSLFSVVLQGISVRPIMRLYRKRKVMQES